MADISNLNIAAAEPIDFSAYKTFGSGGGGSRFPRKGRYTLRAPDSFPREAFGENKARTALTVQIDPVIVGPTAEGKVLKFTRVSAKTFQRDGTVVSQLGDYLLACGLSGKVGGTAQEQADAAEATAGSVYEANLNWRLYEKAGNEDGTDRIIEGMENFPQNDAGEYVPYVLSKKQVDEKGEPKKIWANIVIDSFVPRT